MERNLSQAQQRMADSLMYLFTFIRKYHTQVYFIDEFVRLTYGTDDPFIAIRSTRQCLYGHLWDGAIEVVLRYLKEPFTRMEEDIRCLFSDLTERWLSFMFLFIKVNMAWPQCRSCSHGLLH